MSIKPDYKELWQQLSREFVLLEEENRKLRSALVDAKDMLEFWSSYASDYFKEKHGLSDDLASIAAALKETEDENKN